MCIGAAIVRAAEIDGVGTIALLDLVEHGVEGFMPVIGVEQVVCGLIAFGEIGQGHPTLRVGPGPGGRRCRSSASTGLT